jgi:hypothetical protein
LLSVIVESVPLAAPPPPPPPLVVQATLTPLTGEPFVRTTTRSGARLARTVSVCRSSLGVNFSSDHVVVGVAGGGLET